MKKWHELGKELRRFINPDTFPIAVRFLSHESLIPKGIKTPSNDLKVKIAHCQAAAITRKYGWTLAMTPNDLGCAISGYAYGWKQANKEEAVDFLTRMNYAADSTAALNILESLKILGPGQCGAVVYSPLEWTKVEPDVVLIYLNPAQIMRCLHGSTWQTGKPVICSFSGRAASCTEGVLGAFLDQAPKVVSARKWRSRLGGCPGSRNGVCVACLTSGSLSAGPLQNSRKRHPVSNPDLLTLPT